MRFPSHGMALSGRYAQADTVMRQEIKQLTTCFDKALAPYGGLAAMEEVEARVAAKALDERIEK